MADADSSRPRTAAATDAWRKRGARTAVRGLMARVDALEDRDLWALTEWLIDQCRDRRMDVRNLLNDEQPPRRP